MSGRFKGGVAVNNCRGVKYLRITAGPLRGVYVHTLVARAKLGRELAENETVDHKDGDGLNPHPDNLEVVSQGENTRRANARRWGGQ